MAIEVNVSKSHHVFLGDDNVIRFVIYTNHAQDTVRDVTGWTFSWMLRKRANSSTVLIKKASGDGIAIEGTFNADPEVNTQKVAITLADTDTYDPESSPTVQLRKGKYAHALKRMDDGSETTVVFGSFEFMQAATR